jgi:hypothetical protein
MKTFLLSPLFFFVCALIPNLSTAQLTIEFTFDPTELGNMCGVAHSHDNNELWLYDCSDTEIGKYDLEGNFIEFIPMIGGSANDVDLEIAPEDLMLNGSFVPEGSLLLINGESGVAEIYAIDHLTGEVIDTLVTEFGVSHVVGGAYHPDRDSFYLIQDNVPSGDNANLITEIDPLSGAILDSLPLEGFFDVNFGDLDISSFSGNLFLVSSVETSIAEYTPDGVFIQELPLPEGLTGQSGISLDCENGEAWIVSSAANRITGFICDNVGINQGFRDEFGLTLYPNPSSDVLNIGFQSSPERGKVQIFNNQGQLLIEQGLFQSTDLDISTLSKGQYLLVFQIGSELASRSQFIKL